jgi:hypothetical protein
MLRSVVRNLRKSWTTTPRRSSRALTARPGLEALEDRLAPSTLAITNGALTYNAGAGVTTNLTVTLNGANY